MCWLPSPHHWLFRLASSLPSVWAFHSAPDGIRHASASSGVAADSRRIRPASPPLAALAWSCRSPPIKVMGLRGVHAFLRFRLPRADRRFRSNGDARSSGSALGPARRHNSIFLDVSVGRAGTAISYRIDAADAT